MLKLFSAPVRRVYAPSVRSTEHYFVVANVVGPGGIVDAGFSTFIALSRINGSIQNGALPGGSTIPPSLYLESAPWFFAGYPWPTKGPGVDGNWGVTLHIPAWDRSFTF